MPPRKFKTSWHCNQLIEPVFQFDADWDIKELCVASPREYLNCTGVSRAGTGPTQLFLCMEPRVLGRQFPKTADLEVAPDPR